MVRQNMKPADRAARVVVAGLAVWPALAIGPGTPGGMVILTVAAILAATGLSGFCPLYLAAPAAIHRRR
ncbi:MAG TPA: DUF2892 domain-containing protein [Trebonia sp.]|nr:DUF2892 domain-containing protein [Trebonia sp.]